MLVLAQAKDPYGLDKTAQSAKLVDNPETAPKLTIMIGRVINWGLGFIGVIFKFRRFFPKSENGRFRAFFRLHGPQGLANILFGGRFAQKKSQCEVAS